MNNSDFAQSMQEISKIREYGNFQTIKNRIGETKLKNSLLTLYPKYTIKEIESITGIADSTGARHQRELLRDNTLTHNAKESKWKPSLRNSGIR